MKLSKNWDLPTSSYGTAICCKYISCIYTWNFSIPFPTVQHPNVQKLTFTLSMDKILYRGRGQHPYKVKPLELKELNWNK